jgi:DNA-binding transcriptional ArsR family regulator
MSLGGYATVTLADAAMTVSLKDGGVDPAQAVAVLPNATTAYLALTRVAHLREGEKVLVHGAAGGLAAAFPASPVRTCRESSVSLVLPFVETNEDGGLGLLGDPTRRAIFELLARRPHSVGELAEQLPVSRPAVSQHLRVLKDGGLVVSHPEGTRRVYRLNPDGVAGLRAWLDRVWDDALTAFHKAAEAAPSDPEQESH